MLHHTRASHGSTEALYHVCLNNAHLLSHFQDLNRLPISFAGFTECLPREDKNTRRQLIHKKTGLRKTGSSIT